MPTNPNDPICDLYGHNCEQLGNEARDYCELHDDWEKKHRALNVAVESLRRIRDWNAWNDQEAADNERDYAARRLHDITLILEGK